MTFSKASGRRATRESASATVPGELTQAHLVRVRNPCTQRANVGNALVLVPVLWLGKGLVDDIVKVAERQQMRWRGQCQKGTGQPRSL